ncbi:MAG: AmmeMemoRadiSam system radical SAM enzyme [Deltaproteobacteria bacterium RIFOXYA12_FULL_61_11]|nr:MAG: AmmeMemoRadiSam system radical SAM enzyme [Deltaproteobacteria bacterium RIFOXYA12_FULL_61_11]
MDGQPAKYFVRREDGRLRCTLCPRGCTLRDGQAGLCAVRRNQGGTMVLSTYGQSTGFCIDPIEKKPLNHFYPGTSVLSFGTAGCNLCCRFCQNWKLSTARPEELRSERATAQQIAKRAKDLGCTSVAYTYNDPVVFFEYAVDTARACREQGIKNVAVTAGYLSPPAAEEFFACMDAANVDLKAFSDTFYQRMCSARLQPVLDTLLYLRQSTSVWLELTTLLIPGLNDDPAELAAMTQWIVAKLGPETPLHLSAFHPDHRLLDVRPTSTEDLKKARTIAKRSGLVHVYTGNVHDPKGSSTYCAACKNLLIERDWYQLGRYDLVEGNRCGKCGAVCAGHFDEAPGSWGARRRPVSV